MNTATAARRAPYAIDHTMWSSDTRFVPFAASSPRDYTLSHLIAEDRLHATTDRGARRQVSAVTSDRIAGEWVPVGVYWSVKGRSVYVMWRTGRETYYADVFRPVHMAYAVYWDAETIAHTLAAKLSQHTAYPITARVYR